MCLTIKSGSKMVKISNTSNEKEIQRLDSHFHEDPNNKIFLAREALISGEGQPEILGKMAKSREICCYATREWSILIGNTGQYSLVSKLCIAFSSHMLDQIIC